MRKLPESLDPEANEKAQKRREYQARWAAQWREAHLEEARKRSAAWRKAHPEQHRAEVLAYQKRHPDVNRKATRRYRQKHPDRMQAFVTAWKKKNRERVAVYSHQRRALLAGLTEHFTKEDVIACLLVQGWRCFYCLASLVEGYHVDHMTPLSRHGLNNRDNIVCACPTCNLSKGTKTAAEFILGVTP